MKTIRLKLYKPALDKHLLDNLIWMHTYLWNPQGWKYKRLACSHAGIWVPDENGNYEYTDMTGTTYLGTCYTSTMGQAGGKNRVNYNGICKRPASEVLKHPERWYYYEMQVEANALESALLSADLRVANNKGYDIKDILKYFLPVRTQDVNDDKMICSGFSWWFIYVLYRYSYFGVETPMALENLCIKRTEQHLPSPFRLSLWCKDSGLIPVDLATGKNLI